MASTKIIITLRSSDGELFEISESTAVLSNTLKIMVLLHEQRDILLENINSRTLSDVITYMKKHARVVSDKKKKTFDKEFVSDKDIHALFDILLAADYLKIKGLQEIVSQKISDVMEDKSGEVVKKTWDVKLKTLFQRRNRKEKSVFSIMKTMMKSKSQYRFSFI